MVIGNGRKITYDGKLIVTGTSGAIPAVCTLFNKVNFPSVTFNCTLDGLLEFDENTGEFLFLQRGFLIILANVNFDTPAQPERIEVCTMRDQGSGYGYLYGRSANITVLTNQQATFNGALHINKGDKLRFDLKSNGGSAFLVTETLVSGAVIPAAIIDFVLFNK